MERVSVYRFKEASRSVQDGNLSLAPVKFGPAEIEENPDDEASRSLTWVISTPAVDRDNDTIDVNGWELGDFIKGGAVLWAHDRSAPPIAKPIATWVEDGKLKSRAQFATVEENSFADTIFKLVFGGYIRSASVGFMPIQWRYNAERGEFAVDFLKQALLEWSPVPVPSNPEALSEARSKGIDLAPMVAWAGKALDETESGLLISRETLEAVHKASKPDVAVSVGAEAPSYDELAEKVALLEGRVKELEPGDTDVGDAIADVAGDRVDTTKDTEEGDQKDADADADAGDQKDADAGDEEDCLLEIDDEAADAGEGFDSADVKTVLTDTLKTLVDETVDAAIRKRKGQLD